jgi:hypothetical protein
MADEKEQLNGSDQPTDQVPEQAPDPATDQPADEVEDGGEPEVAFSWQASEFVHHHKSPVWYGVLAMVVVVLTAAAVWLGLWLEIGVFFAMAAAVVVYARKPPRTLLYELSSTGIQIDGKEYPFVDFRSFSVVADEEWHSIDLEPTKRLSPRLVLLFDSSNFDEIVGHLELHLPREDREPDVIERFTRFVRF